MAPPTIRTAARYNTHDEHSIDFFGTELIVTVTPTASVISRWINDAQYNYRAQYSFYPLVVGVGVQWSHAGYHHSSTPRDSCYSDPPNYYVAPTPGSYNVVAPTPGSYNVVAPTPGSYNVVVPWNGYYANPPRVSNYVNPPPVNNYANPPPVNNYVNPPPVNNYYNPPPVTNYYNPPTVNNYYNPPPVNNYAYRPQSSYYTNPPLPYGYYSDDPQADTLQLCVGKRCLIIQLSHCDRIPDDLRSFLVNPQTIFVGVGNGQDAGKLLRSRHRLDIGELRDIRNYVRDSEGWILDRYSFEEIVEECMGYPGVRLDREISTSDWSVYDLSYEQILQASLDVFVCSYLGVWFRIWQLLR